VVVNHRASAPQAEEVVAAVTAAGDEAVAIQADVTSFADLSWEQLGGKLHRELRAAFLITKAVVPGMISRGYGRLVYLSTGLSRRPRDGMITLGTAKAALAGAAI
jgi:3-oxoacyl-[acyl-carrier protein] reductase